MNIENFAHSQSSILTFIITIEMEHPANLLKPIDEIREISGCSPLEGWFHNSLSFEIHKFCHGHSGQGKIPKEHSAISWSQNL